MNITNLTYRWKDINWEWHYWYLVKEDSSSYYIVDTFEPRKKWTIITYNMVVSSTIWIYTGIKDKMWRKIYNGDKVRNMWKIMEVVYEIFDKWRWCPTWKHAWFYCKDEYWQLWCFENDYIEIINEEHINDN